jgi:hypothetical protein
MIAPLRRNDAVPRRTLGDTAAKDNQLVDVPRFALANARLPVEVAK